MSARLAASQLIGGLKSRIKEIRQVLIDILTEIEFSIDFPDEEVSQLMQSHIADRLNERVLEPIKKLVAAYTQRKIWHEGITAVIVGRVNAGKSSILNRFLREDKAIVTPIPGTTRDILEYMVTVEGLPLKLVDTAGMRKVKGEIEKKGLDLTNSQLGLADLTILVIDRSRSLNKYDLSLLQQVDKTATLVIVNKTDLPAKLSEEKINSVFRGFHNVSISALTGEGFDKLKKAIFNKVVSKKIEFSSTSIVPNLRHKTTLTNASASVKKASTNLKNGFPLEMVAEDLIWAKNAIDEITGNKTNEEILSNIFTKFCVGK